MDDLWLDVPGYGFWWDRSLWRVTVRDAVLWPSAARMGPAGSHASGPRMVRDGRSGSGALARERRALGGWR